MSVTFIVLPRHEGTRIQVHEPFMAHRLHASERLEVVLSVPMSPLSSNFPDFAVSCGEEGSDPLIHYEGSEIRVDQFRSSRHFENRDADLADVANLGIRVWRYGMPWRLSEPSEGTYDWTLWDAAFESCRRNGLEPVVDLLHFGLPDHYQGFSDRRWVDGFIRYVEAFLQRYPDPVWFTPVNEPGITATFSARFGMWNDRTASDETYFECLGNIVLANLEALALIRSDRDGWWISSEGFGCALLGDDDDQAKVESINARDMEWLVWDLHFGVEPQGQALNALDVINGSDLDRIGELSRSVPPDRVVAGHDIYPISVTPYGSRADRPVSLTDRLGAYVATAREWYERYDREFWVSETSNLGLTVDEGPAWLTELTESLYSMRGEGLPVRGVCWYSRGDQYDWDSALTLPLGKVTEVGLFDADRRARPVSLVMADLARRHPFITTTTADEPGV